MYNYDCEHVGKANFRTKGHEEDILIKNGMNGEQIEQILKTEGLPMSMNLYMYIRRQLEMKANDKL